MIDLGWILFLVIGLLYVTLLILTFGPSHVKKQLIKNRKTLLERLGDFADFEMPDFKNIEEDQKFDLTFRSHPNHPEDDSPAIDVIEAKGVFTSIKIDLSKVMGCRTPEEEEFVGIPFPAVLFANSRLIQLGEKFEVFIDANENFGIHDHTAMKIFQSILSGSPKDYWQSFTDGSRYQ